MWIKQAHIRVAAGVAVAFVVAPVISQWFVALADENGFYKRPAERAYLVMVALTSSPWFHWIGGIVIGFAFGVWLDALVRRNEQRATVRSAAPLPRGTDARIAPPTHTLENVLPPPPPPPPARPPPPSPFLVPREEDVRPHLWVDRIEHHVTNEAYNKKLVRSYLVISNKTASDLKNCSVSVFIVKGKVTSYIEKPILNGPNLEEKFSIEKGSSENIPFIFKNVNVVPEQSFRIGVGPRQSKIVGPEIIDLTGNSTYRIEMVLDSGDQVQTLIAVKAQMGHYEQMTLEIEEQFSVRKISLPPSGLKRP